MGDAAKGKDNAPRMGWKKFALTLRDKWTSDGISDVAGSVTFFAVLALFPFLLFLISLASVFMNPQSAQTLVDELGKVAPPPVTDILGGRIRELGQSRSAGLSVASGVVALWSASGGMASLMKALNVVNGTKDERPFWKTRGISLVMTVLAAVVAIVAVLVAVALPPLARLLGAAGSVVLYARLPVAALLMMLLWATLYALLPADRPRFRFITPGSVVAVLVWAVASWGFSVYVNHFGSYQKTYGALGGVIVLLFWMWISAQVLLLGAEINAVLAARRGKPLQADAG